MRTDFPEKPARQAYDRLRYVQPETAGKILGHDRYWTVPFLRQMIERCDLFAFEDPRASAQLAEFLPLLADRIPIDADDAEYYLHREEKASAIVYSWAVRGSCNRAAGEIPAARYAFDQGRREAADSRIDAEAYGEFLRRRGIFEWTVQKEESVETLSRAIEIYGSSESLWEGLADAYVARGMAHHVVTGDYGSAIRDYGTGLEVLQDRKKTPRSDRTLVAALHNLGFLVLEHTSLEDLGRAERIIGEARRLTKDRYRSRARALAFWSESMLMQRLGFFRHASRTMKRTVDVLLKIEMPLDAAIAALDLVNICVLDEDEEGIDLALQVLADLIEENDELAKALPRNWQRIRSESEVRAAQEQVREMQRTSQHPPETADP